MKLSYKVMGWGLIIGGVLFGMGCEKNDKEVQFKYDYFPTAIGHSVTYEVDSIVIDKKANKYDTSHYFVKDKVVEQFEDLEGRTAYRILRYKKKKKSHSWQEELVYFATRADRRLEVQENNLRFVKLAFPPVKGKEWQGNSLLDNSVIEDNALIYPCYPDMEGWDYTYHYVDQADTLNNSRFDSTLKVEQKVSGNLVDTVYFVEKYARDVGMIYQKRYHKQDDNATANWQNPSCANIKILRLIDYSS